MSAPTISPDVLVPKLLDLGVTENAARSLATYDYHLALDAISGDVELGRDGQVLVRDTALHVEHDPSCRVCGGAGHPDGPCGWCAVEVR